VWPTVFPSFPRLDLGPFAVTAFKRLLSLLRVRQMAVPPSLRLDFVPGVFEIPRPQLGPSFAPMPEALIVVVPGDVFVAELPVRSERAEPCQNMRVVISVIG